VADSNPFSAAIGMFDSYSRVARVYPSLIALAPLIWSALALFPSIFSSLGNSAAFVVGATCVFYFFASITRYLGKKAESKLLKRWGGWPTTMLLRHRNDILDPLTKARYHNALSKLCNLQPPSAADETNDQAAADNFYRSATKKLIEQRRGPENRLLHSENASYGFRRNLYGLKPVAVAETLILMTLTAFGWWLITPQPYTRLVVAESVIHYPYFPVLLGLDLGYLLLWFWAVTPTFVFQAGREYGEALLRTLDS
jgi:hypothetical protein